MTPLLPNLTAAAILFSSGVTHADDITKGQLAYDTKGTKVTLVSEHFLPDLPGKSVKRVLVEYEPGGYNSAHTHAKSAIIYATVLEGAV